MGLDQNGQQPPAAASPSGMQLDDPMAAAAAALGELGTEGEPLAGDAQASAAAPTVDPHKLRLQLRGLVLTVDWLATSALGPKMALEKPKDVEALVDAWMPYCEEIGGLDNLPTWLTGLVITAGVYAPRVRAALEDRRAKKAAGGEEQAGRRAA